MSSPDIRCSCKIADVDCSADNQPEFMQNLGFVPDAGLPELYSYSSQVEPFLLAQTQQLPMTDPPGGATTGDSTGN